MSNFLFWRIILYNSSENFVFSPLVKYYATFLRSEPSWKKSGGFACRRETALASDGRLRALSWPLPLCGGSQTPHFFPTLLTSQKRCIILNQWAEKENTHLRYKKLFANKRSYSSSKNTIIPMIRRFYSATSYNLSGKHKKVSTLKESKIRCNADFVLR